MKIDTHQHLGIYGVNAKEIRDNFDYVVLNPSYKYSCNCCVDGFYQQYLWNKGRDYLQLGIYNLKCRVPAGVELGRQLDKGIVGIVLNPINHDFDLDKADDVYQFAEDHDLPLFIYTGRGKGDPSKLTEVLKNFRLKVVLISLGYPNYVNEARELLKLNNVYGDISSVPQNVIKTFPREKLIFGSHYPYVPFQEIMDKEILSNAVKILSI
ncbi:amidohydrolase family protein [Sulfolobus acidocaldarius]|uniref:Conserved protein n=4 Tax=Sulfolobus acidocaldarius TaxID=2285 RepID=Q4J6V8_SULAC|nr:amidohydrolase family protein [Sulfolobus acidocaldarius]AAY81473.1 conserved protein [Sulfolobus acidocaldarius DSM 639]AGE72076.1 hypothetical protein SacN8_10650 [Sulfolobus acidocaldarius N8]AGE74394.1 hypothetical protein SacRon12I_10900 [Sulfolobus acidocaldarius Ron12/I]ALU29740.1 hypothetical protein ATY89_07165 [Sulfolobus acidocaldarius]ALU32476.1 hypothetical protein ATZ20_10185 [Sulfolobus acidocaldarius]